jgi:hypothetical protein
MSNRYCNEQTAYQTGYDDASAGQVGKPNRNKGAACQDEYSPSSFQKDYDGGFMAGQRELCSDSHAAQMGRDEGSAPIPKMKSEDVFEVCGDPQKAKDSYRKAFLGKACTESAAKKLGTAQGDDLEEQDYSSLEEVCTLPAHRPLKAAFLKSYADAARKRCMAPASEARGIRDARAGKDLSREIEKLASCPEAQQDTAITAYRRGHSDTTLLMAREEEVKLAKSKAEEDRKFRQQQLELERERIRAEAGLPLTGGAGVGSGGGHSGGGSVGGGRDDEETGGSEAFRFRHDGRDLIATCRLDKKREEADVEVTNLDRRSVTLGGLWRVEFWDARRRLIQQNEKRTVLLIQGGAKDDFDVDYKLKRQPGARKPPEPVACVARYTGA